jgi:hypothetical protein
MTEKIIFLNITNNKLFNKVQFEKYENLEELIIDNVIIEDYDVINNFLSSLKMDKIHIFECNFLYLNYNKKHTKITIKLLYNEFVLFISDYDSNIKKFMNNLPIQINKINIKYCNSLDKCFENLPILLNEIVISYDTKINHLDLCSYDYNCLFNVKLPFDCILKISFLDNDIYEVSYENNTEEQLTLVCLMSGNKRIIKYYVNSFNYFDQVYSTNYNILRIMAGMRGLGFSN